MGSSLLAASYAGLAPFRLDVKVLFRYVEFEFNDVVRLHDV